MLATVLLSSACETSSGDETAAPTTTARPPTTAAVSSTAPPASIDPVVLAAGDIASCSSSGDERTAALLDQHPSAVVVTLGDHAYDRGSTGQFRDCYDPSWGRSRSRTRPSPGNHDYATRGAVGYFDYFGGAAGEPANGYYSYDLGSWLVVALNSNCTAVSCAPGSAQERWLRERLATHPGVCTLAYWHHPRFSSGTTHGSSDTVGPLWQALYDHDADLVLQGHEHNYERFGPLDPSGRVDVGRGVRSFVVGTGGRSHYRLGTPIAGSEARNDDTYGVLHLTLHADGFTWRFIAEAGGTYVDAGSAPCH